MKRSGMKPRTKPMKRTSRASLTVVRDIESAPRRKAPAGTGPDKAARKLVLERDGYMCVCCGRSILGKRYSLGHRLRASQGGKAVPSNLLTFLGWGGEACHGRIDHREDPADEAKGFTIRSGHDPALVSVMVFSEHGSGATKYLTEAGGYSDYPPGGSAA